ncbi:MAG TPA: hypothetical protein VG604_04910 [Candidatus Saccharimonadales bacterium]|nr:hypothetical protein [Candidatus Saccharimonadales bacterium]
MAYGDLPNSWWSPSKIIIGEHSERAPISMIRSLEEELQVVLDETFPGCADLTGNHQFLDCLSWSGAVVAARHHLEYDLDKGWLEKTGPDPTPVVLERPKKPFSRLLSAIGVH